ncbi:FeS-binding protein [Streptomyces sp. Ru71]|uniref:Rieske (2Fe-2S) protein n=1 Tax=Streptomyces sp. Ru71 TaxID=2080746 RepID=UPI000CDDF441|nr:Rieske (2Fe-2S) protein [Streptomyces sp. Ru71]POX53364.1 FeS-binding protein [Streptomyces sp. Ru71]
MSGSPVPSRRTLLKGAAAVPAAGLGLTACSESGPGRPTGPVDVGAESEVPQGGAKLDRKHNVVVSRDSAGSLKAFSTICTHAQCPIAKLDGTKLTCTCHGSQFDATTGEVLHAPATEPLKELSVKVENGRIVASPSA